MTATATAPPAPRPGSRKRPISPLHKAIRGLGELMITLGVVMLLLVVYQLFWTNLQAGREQGALKDDLLQEWAAPAPKDKKLKPVPGNAIALMYFQRLGDKWVKPVVEGVGLDDLKKGVGHFPKSALPGAVGNFAVAAHRATHGEPFKDLDAVRKGDRLVIETRESWFVYKITTNFRLVDPSYGEVVLPVPEKPGVKPTEKLITLVTCNPRWGSSTRLIYYGELESSSVKKNGERPAQLAYFGK